MAKVIVLVCDRCGARSEDSLTLEISSKWKVINEPIGGYNQVSERLLCPNCRESFQQWFEEPKQKV